jgi:hypothetical protein
MNDDYIKAKAEEVTTFKRIIKLSAHVQQLSDLHAITTDMETPFCDDVVWEAVAVITRQSKFAVLDQMREVLDVL